MIKQQQRKTGKYIWKEEGILGEAEYHIRRPMPSSTAGARPTLRKGGWRRPMGAASHRPHARSLRPLGAISPGTPHKPSGQIPCQHERVQNRPLMVILQKNKTISYPKRVITPAHTQGCLPDSASLRPRLSMIIPPWTIVPPSIPTRVPLVISNR